LSWFFYALLAPALYSCITFIDKYLLEREVPDYRGMPIYGAIMAAIFGVLLWAGLGLPRVPPGVALPVLLTGMLGIWGVALYFRALADEHGSTIVVLVQMIPLFVLILSFVFLDERIAALQLLGFGLILGAALAVSRRPGPFRLRLSAAFGWMLLASLMWAAQLVLFKALVTETPFARVVAWEAWGFGLGGLVLYAAFPPIRGAFHATLRTVRRRALAVIFANEGLSIAAKLVGFLAISLGPVALVSVLGSTEVFMAVLLGWLLTLAAPKVYHEEIAPSDLLRKGALAGVMFAGLLLVG
jgi:drug/metabolite transporter (DMT)-like permease